MLDDSIIAEDSPRNEDARASRKGCYSAWLIKAKNEAARLRLLQSSTTRYFTIDFDAQIFYYSHSITQKKVSQPIPFRDFLGAERLPLPVKSRRGKSQTFGFTLNTKDRHFELYTSSAADAAQWTFALNAAMEAGKKAKERTPLGALKVEAKRQKQVSQQQEEDQSLPPPSLPSQLPPSAEEEEEAARKVEEEAEAVRRQAEEAEAAKRKVEEAEAARKQAEEEAEAARVKLEEEAEAARKQAEEEAEAARRKQEEEEAAQRLQEEAEAARKHAEEEEKAARRKKEEEEAVRKLQEEEEAARKRAEEEEAARRQPEEAAKEAKRKAEEEAEAARTKQAEEKQMPPRGDDCTGAPESMEDLKVSLRELLEETMRSGALAEALDALAEEEAFPSTNAEGNPGSGATQELPDLKIDVSQLLDDSFRRWSGSSADVVDSVRHKEALLPPAMAEGEASDIVLQEKMELLKLPEDCRSQCVSSAEALTSLPGTESDVVLQEKIDLHQLVNDCDRRWSESSAEALVSLPEDHASSRNIQDLNGMKADLRDLLEETYRSGALADALDMMAEEEPSDETVELSELKADLQDLLKEAYLSGVMAEALDLMPQEEVQTAALLQ